ncbi:hypothetical protein SAICODRAFT_72980 [Saitoella complicata NRRL Y-17804]|uniref:uncharacterized protein n=1 Tax=Saitoella complicata (strain BCRC 22490 / CBS 7301 / JCM 7358 / NBRC 10748 / NRRL Y-17804) TaxID=698492 RepID=UPI00086803ED|nr:uncharacterized protein SAICODRAFT_72980 [Saitoella complicata NRRL Y-17804]ODQ51084.1 hypothetical protein SAICODRAFT_72980 [Saitoella complicata NRRL Y-17804]
MPPFFSSPTGKHCILYHTNWCNYARSFNVKDLPIDSVTDICYAFFNLAPSIDNANLWVITSGDRWADFENPFMGKGAPPENTWQSPPQDLGNLGQFRKLLASGARINITLSIGGWTWSKHFSEASRDSLAQSVIKFFKEWDVFNGVSFDWEYVSNNGVNYGADGNVTHPSDAANLLLFIKRVRILFHDEGWLDYTISLCCTPAPEKIKFKVEEFVEVLDQFHIMTYDFSGSWSKIAAHQSNLYNSQYSAYSVDTAVKEYLARGVPAAKVFIGVPFYSRGFVTQGLGCPSSGASPDTSWEAGVVDYKKLPLPGAEELWDEEAQAAYSYDKNRKVLNTYDDPRAVQEKCDYVKRLGLGGLIVWESSADFSSDHDRSLLKVIKQSLTHKNPRDSSEISMHEVGKALEDLEGKKEEQQPKRVAAPSLPSMSTSIYGGYPRRGLPTPPDTSAPSLLSQKTLDSHGTPPPVPLSTKPKEMSTPVKHGASSVSSQTSASTAIRGSYKAAPPLPPHRVVYRIQPTSRPSSVNVEYRGSTYECMLAHSGLPNWNPEDASTLWKRRT